MNRLNKRWMLPIKPLPTILDNFYRRGTASLRSLPDFLIIGAQKGGTSSFHHLLSQHPDIHMARRKEVHFFDINYHKGLNWYRSFFPIKNSKRTFLCGEATPSYLSRQGIPEKVRSVLPEVKIIVLLRDPTERLLSQYRMNKVNLNLDFDFDEYVRLNLNKETRMVGKRGTLKTKRFTGLARGEYSKQLKQWLVHFPKIQFLFLESEVLYKQPLTILKKTHEFLKVPHIAPTDYTPQNQSSDRVKMSSHSRTILNDFYQEEKAALREMEFDFSWL